MPELPQGVVTFVFTDVEGSTRLWEDAPDTMMKALNDHDEVIDELIAHHGGVSVKPRGEGDSRFLVFPEAAGAVAAIAGIQARFSAQDWPTPRPLKVRASIHTGAADLQLGDYYGPAVNRAARLRGIAHGGQTVLSAATWELVQDRLPTGVTATDMGEHLLKDLTRPEHVYQLDVDGLQSGFPPLTSLGAVPNNLPEQLTEFVGRDAELEEAKGLLADTRLLTMLAPGGTGKTRLGIQVAADLAAEFPDGVFFVELAEIEAADEIVQYVAESIGAGLTTEDDLETQLLSYLANKRQLLVLDNFEHVAEGSTLIGEILRAAPDVKVIATSRSKLRLTGETVYPLGGLEIAWEDHEAALQCGGVRLFLDAAKRANPGFVIGRADLAALARILSVTGGSPLGIILAAAWVDMLPVAEIADEVERSLDFLETEMGDVPDRHRSVRAVFDYSWALLSDQERELFASLSVFRGGFTREAAGEVAGATLRNLATLSNKSLVSASPADGRYAIHELLRQYALSELEKEPVRFEEVLGAHADYYGALVEATEDLLISADQLTMAARLEADIENIRAGFRRQLAAGDAVGAARFPVGLYYLYEWRGWYTTGVSLFAEGVEALEDARGEDAAAVRAVCLAAKGWFLSLLGQTVAGARAAQQGWDMLPERASVAQRYVIRQCLAVAQAYLGAADDMARISEEGISAAAREGQEFWEAGMGNWRAFAAMLNGDPDTAKEYVPPAMVVFERLNDHYYSIWNYWLQAMLATGEGRTDDAVALHARQVAIAEELDYLRGRVVAYEGLGDANRAAGDAAAAEVAFVRGIEVADQMGMLRDMLNLMAKIAAVRVESGRGADAVGLLAVVCADPASAEQSFTANVPIRDTANELLDRLRGQLDAATFATAFQDGSMRAADVAAKELIDSIR